MSDLKIRSATTGLDHSAVLTECGQVVFWGFLRRPNKWQGGGYGPLATATQIVPMIIEGPWVAEGKRVCALASGSNKCICLVEAIGEALMLEDEQALQDEGTLQLRSSAAPGGHAGAKSRQLQAENAELRKQVEELSVQLNRAQGVFTEYLPMFSIDRPDPPGN